MLYKRFNDTAFDGIMYNAVSLFRYPTNAWGAALIWLNDNDDEITKKIITEDVEHDYLAGIYVRDTILDRHSDFPKLVHTLVKSGLINKEEDGVKPLYDGSYYNLQLNTHLLELVNKFSHIA